MSTTMSPVTHTAEVEVKSASKSLIPSKVAFGSSKSPVPSIIIPKKLRMNNCAGLKKALLRLSFLDANSLINTKKIAA